VNCDAADLSFAISHLSFVIATAIVLAVAKQAGAREATD
jgi:hypothetical protein